jgi:hypothetical protein
VRESGTYALRQSCSAYDRAMRIAGIAAGLVIAVIGGGWTLQGLNSQIVPQSFMTGSRTWVLIGFATLVAGLALARWSWTRRAAPPE